MRRSIESMRTRLSACAAFVRFEEPLWRHTTFRIGGPAEFFLEPRTRDELTEALRMICGAGMLWRVLGGGSNLLVSDDGVRGAVISLRRMGPREIALHARGLRVSAAAALRAVVRQAAKWGLSGMARFSGIPGTVGGAIRMNAGAGGRSIGELVSCVHLLHADGRVETVPGNRIGWRYRAAEIPRDSIVLAAELRLAKGRRRRIEEEGDRLLSRKKATQPLSRASAGCVFRNPRDAFAGELIEHAGAKGMRMGGALVSPKHANFIVNTGPARARDVGRLIRRVQEMVRRRSGYRLHPEIHEWTDGRQEWEG